MVTSMVLDPECWVPGRRAPPRGSRGWSPMDGAAGARSRPRPKIQDPRPDSWHPLDDRRPHQAGEGQRQLLPDPDRPLVLRIGRADVRQAPGLDQVVLVAERGLVHPPPGLELVSPGLALAAAEVEGPEAVLPPPPQDREVEVFVDAARFLRAVRPGVEGHHH